MAAVWVLSSCVAKSVLAVAVSIRRHMPSLPREASLHWQQLHARMSRPLALTPPFLRFGLFGWVRTSGTAGKNKMYKEKTRRS